MTRTAESPTTHELDGCPVVCRSRRFHRGQLRRRDHDVVIDDGSSVLSRFGLPAPWPAEQLARVVEQLDELPPGEVFALNLAPRPVPRGTGWIDVTYYVTGVEVLR